MTPSLHDVPLHDVLVVGSGLVGASLACALHGSGLEVALVEASAGAADPPPSFDERNLALARGSCNALRALGVWAGLASPPSPIERLHISSEGDFGTVRLQAEAFGVPAFGAVVAARELGAALEARLAQLHDLPRLRPARVIAIDARPDCWRVTLRCGDATRQHDTRLLVAADGTGSEVRGLLGIGSTRHDYAQTLFVTAAQVERPHAQVAYERFTPHGPVAMLPLAPEASNLRGGGARVASICTVAAAAADAVAALDDAGYAALLQRRFGWRLGRVLRVGRRSGYALQQVRADAIVAPRAVLIGNAAQTIHPIGAQGFNLGLRDALTLAEELRVAAHAHTDPGAAPLLQRYARRRRDDREQTIALSDGLVRAFSQRLAPVRALRSLGLLALDRLPGANHVLVAGAMGYRGDVPRLLREEAA